jgi:dihydroflavonol-4-reductase
VFHVAAVADYWQADRQHLYAVNVEGTRRVLRAARDAGVRRTVFTSSAAAVGFKEDGAPADEHEPFSLSPHQFPYGHSKHMAERAARCAWDDHSQEVVIVNPVVVMGPGDLNLISGRFITEMARLQWAIPVTSGGVGVTDVRDVARWHIAAAENGVPGERYILGTANYSFNDWYALIADTVGVPRPFLPAPGLALPLVAALVERLRALGVTLPVDPDQTRMGARRIFFDYSKAWNAFGPPQVDMHTSVRETYDWYAARGLIEADAAARAITRAGALLGLNAARP